MRIVLLLVSVLLLCVPVSAQTWWVGPGDTVKIPLVLYDSINNPAAVDSAADSVLIRVVKNFAANAGGADTCYLHRGLMDASTNTNLHTTGNATTTLGFGQTPKRVQTFSFFATAYTLTNSATASGTYTIEVFTYDHSLNLITTRFYSLNYIYQGASTNTYAHWADSVMVAKRSILANTDTTNAILDTLQVTDTRWDSTLAVFADANTLMKNRLLRIRDSVDNILDTLQLHDNWVAKEASVTIVRDTLALYDTRWDSLLAVVADANTLFKNRLLRLRDTVDVILDTLQSQDGWAAKEASVQIVRDTLALYDTRWDSLLAVAADNNTLFKNRLLRIRDTVDAVLDTLQTYDGVMATVTNQTLIKDTVNAILDTLQLYDGRYALASELTKAIDTTNAILDTLQNVSSALRVDTNTTWTAAQRDTLLNRTLVTKDSTYAVLDTLQNTSSSLRVDTNTVWSAAQRDTLLNRSLVTKDSVYATLDTLQNGSSTLRVATVDTAAISKSVKERLFADTAKKIGFSGGGGDSVKAVAMASVDSAAVARSVWDNDITVQANRTVTANMTFDTVLLDKARDSVNAILDTLQNLSSTLRLAGSDLDTVYQVVQCDDTMAGDFLLTLADYRAQIKHKMGVAQTNTTWMTDSVLNQLTREAIVTVNPIMRGYKTSITKVTQFDSSDYPLDSLVGVGSVVWYKNDTARSIPYLAREKWATLTQQTTWGADDPYMERPQVYDYTDDQISFFPTPTSNDSVKINGWAKVPNITVISAVSQIPQKYRVAVLKYATWLVARAKQHQSAQTFLDEYHESLAFLVAGLNETQADSK